MTKAQKIMIDTAELLKILADAALKVNAPKVFIKHLAAASTEINNAYEIYMATNDILKENDN